MNLKFYSVMTIQRLLFACIMMLTLSFSANGQDRTAASAYNDGLTELKAKNYETGLTLMEEALSLSEEGKDDKVIRLAKKNGAIAAYNMAKAKKEAGMMDEALALYEKGIEFNPEYVNNFSGKAIVLQDKGDKMGAMNAFIMAGDAYPENKADRAAKMYKRAQNIVGKMYTGKSYDEGIAAGKAFLEKRPDNAEVNYFVARCMIEKAQNEEALAHADNAITLAGDAPEDKYYIAKGMALENLGKSADAITTYKMVTGEKYKKQAEYRIQKLGS
jgi:tetratricopeptide (TPR) repeat protein